LHTFTRASDKTYFDVNGELQVAGPNVPVFDYDPVTQKFRLSVNESRRSLFLRNTNVLNSYWVGSRITKIDTETPSIIEGVSWQRIQASETNVNGYFFRPPTTALDGSNTHTSQYIVQKGNKDFCVINAIGSGGGAVRQWFNLATGEKGSQTSAGTAGDVTFLESTIKKIKQDVYVITLSVTFFNASGNVFNMYPSTSTNGGFSCTIGDFLDFCYCGAEDGPFNTPPILTDTTTQERLQDTVLIPDIDTLDWWENSSGTFIVEAQAKVGDVVIRVGAFEIVSDSSTIKTYSGSYTNELSTTIEIMPGANGFIQEIIYEQ
jgi:hypothetical protein